jgi:hypothetical protein
VVGWSPAGEARGGDASDPSVVAAAFAGVALSVAGRDPALTGSTGRDEPPLGAGAVEREVAGALAAVAPGASPEGHALPEVLERGARAARAAFEDRIEVPPATVAREDDDVRLGRRDPRAAALGVAATRHTAR